MVIYSKSLLSMVRQIFGGQHFDQYWKTISNELLLKSARILCACFCLFVRFLFCTNYLYQIFWHIFWSLHRMPSMWQWLLNENLPSMLYLTPNNSLCFMQDEGDRETFICRLRCRFLEACIEQLLLDFWSSNTNPLFWALTIPLPYLWQFLKLWCNSILYAKLSPLSHLYKIQCYTFNLQSSVSMASGYFIDY